MINTEKINCTGCGACQQICPAGCIKMVPDREGFLYPQVDMGSCISCGKCIDVCIDGYDFVDMDEPFQAVYAVKNKDEEIRRKSSSGGVFYALADEVISRQGMVFGAAFDDAFRVIHKGTETQDGIFQFMGSKYVQSDTEETFVAAEEALKQDRWVLYSGTPCQIIGLKLYLGRDYEKLLTVSLLCHGVPSPEVWRRYLERMKGVYAADSIREAYFRDKFYGWGTYSIRLLFDEKNTYREKNFRDLYMRGFSQDLYLRPHCYNCKAKRIPQDSDLLIGDFWGIDEFAPQFNDDKGVSCVLISTDKGLRFWNDIQENFECIETVWQQVGRRNVIKNSLAMNPRREAFFTQLWESGVLEDAIEANVKPTVITEEYRSIRQYPILLEYLKNKISGRQIGEVFARMNWSRIVLYAVTDIMELFFQDLEGSSVHVVCLCDMREGVFQEGVLGKDVVGIAKLAEMNGTDVFDGVVICHPIREEEIRSSLMAEGIPAEKIMLATEVIRNM